MRLLRLYPFIPPLSGGMEKHVLRLTQEQRALGCDVTLAFNGGEARSPQDLKVLPAVDLRRLRPQSLRDVIFYLAVLVRVVRGIRVDVIHIHGDWSAFLFGRVLARTAGAKVLVASVHGAIRTGHWVLVYKWVLNGYGVVYCTGAADAVRLQTAGVRAARWQNSGVDAEFFADNLPSGGGAAKTDVVCVANFFPVKNLALAIEIAKAMPDASFVIVGDGPQRSALEMCCRRDGVRNVRFTGRLSAGHLIQQVRASHIFLSTSISEGTPTALLEAMACGLPVVTSRSNDYRGLIKNGRNGYVVDGFDVNSYVRLLNELLSDRQLWHAISVRNRSEARQHAWPAVAARITDWTRECMA